MYAQLLLCVSLYKIYRLQTRLQPTALLLGRWIHPSAMVLDQLDQGVSGTFHSNAALHNSLQKQRCIVFSRMGTAASGIRTSNCRSKKHCSITGSQPHLRALEVLTGPGSSGQYQTCLAQVFLRPANKQIRMHSYCSTT